MKICWFSLCTREAAAGVDVVLSLEVVSRDLLRRLDVDDVKDIQKPKLGGDGGVYVGKEVVCEVRWCARIQVAGSDDAAQCFSLFSAFLLSNAFCRVADLSNLAVLLCENFSAKRLGPFAEASRKAQ